MLENSKQHALKFLWKIKRSVTIFDVFLSTFGISGKSQSCWYANINPRKLYKKVYPQKLIHKKINSREN